MNKRFKIIIIRWFLNVIKVILVNDKRGDKERKQAGSATGQAEGVTGQAGGVTGQAGGVTGQAGVVTDKLEV